METLKQVLEELKAEEDMDAGVDYKQMYIKLFNAAERAKSILTAAQQECEEMYLTPREWDLAAIRRDMAAHK